MNHISLDIETLGTRPGFIVLSAAFVRFSDLASVSINLSIPDQQALGLEVDPATHAWWGTQDPASWAAATEKPVPLKDALAYIPTWLQWATGGEDFFIWCHGASFDAPILGEVFRRAGLPTPWSFRNIRDTRTLYDLAGVSVVHGPGPAHVALTDALAQTHAAIEALGKLASVRMPVAA